MRGTRSEQRGRARERARRQGFPACLVSRYTGGGSERVEGTKMAAPYVTDESGEWRAARRQWCVLYTSLTANSPEVFSFQCVSSGVLVCAVSPEHPLIVVCWQHPAPFTVHTDTWSSPLIGSHLYHTLCTHTAFLHMCLQCVYMHCWCILFISSYFLLLSCICTHFMAQNAMYWFSVHMGALQLCKLHILH